MKSVTRNQGNTPRRMPIFSRCCVSVAISVAALAPIQSKPQPAPAAVDFDHWYSRSQARGPVPQLQKRLETNPGILKHDPRFGYLPALLDDLGISPASQVLVFSKTSSQRSLISPRTPRAIYFNDQVYVAWIPGSPQIEISCVDPTLGAVFFTLEQLVVAKPALPRQDQCLECHTSSANLGIPGYLLRSVITDDRGIVQLSRGLSSVTHEVPLALRWGGWYVCGTHRGQSHLGNLVSPSAFAHHAANPELSGNVSDLGSILDTAQYLEPTSDIVALMVLDHQIHMQNLLTRLHYDAARRLSDSPDIAPLKHTADTLLKYLLFADECPLTSPIEGVSGFEEWFEAQGPNDRQGRSLRQFDLKTRLFKYPCSYLIYSPSFEALPRGIKLHLYRRLWKVLNGEDNDPAFARLSPEMKHTIREILLDTQPDLPIYWRLDSPRVLNRTVQSTQAIISPR